MNNTAAFAEKIKKENTEWAGAAADWLFILFFAVRIYV